MRRFNFAAVIVLVVAGLFAVASAGYHADEPRVPNARTQALLKERLAIYHEIYETERAVHSTGSGSFHQLMEAQSSLLRAELDLCETKAQRIVVSEKLVKVAEQAAEAAANSEKAAGTTHTVMLNAKARLIEARIALENEKAAI